MRHFQWIQWTEISPSKLANKFNPMKLAKFMIVLPNGQLAISSIQFAYFYKQIQSHFTCAAGVRGQKKQAAIMIIIIIIIIIRCLD